MTEVIRFKAQDAVVESSTVAYDGFFKIQKLELKHQLFEGGFSPTLSRELCIRHDAVGVLLYDPNQQKFALVEQFRVGALNRQHSPWMLEIVAGMLDKPEENPEEVARRESIEESGLSVEKIEPMLDYFVSPGGNSERFNLFIGKVDLAHCEGGIFGLEAEGEDILLHILDVDYVLRLLAKGNINNSMTIIALQWFALNQSSINAQWR